jgi:hypothetical protein
MTDIVTEVDPQADEDALVAPHPIPFRYVIEEHPAGYVIVSVHDATGVRVMFMPNDFARDFAENVANAANRNTSGLIVPTVHGL